MLPDYSAGYGLDQSGNPIVTNQGLNQGLTAPNSSNLPYSNNGGYYNAGDNSNWNITDSNGNFNFQNQGLNPSNSSALTSQPFNQGLMALGQQGGGNPLYSMNGLQNNMGYGRASDGGISVRENVGNADTSSPTYQAQNSGTAQAQTATQPQMNNGNAYSGFLNNLYQQKLNRAPDQAGYQFWQNALNSGQSPQDVIKAFQNSPEYQANQALKPAANPNYNPYGLTGANAVGNQTSTNPYIQAAQNTAVGNYQGAQAATSVNRVNQNTPYANLQYQQTGTDANGNPIWSANQSLNPQLQTALGGLQNRLASTAGQGINTSALAQTGINPGELYSDAIMRRLQPQLDRQSAQSDTQLANQGIMPGSAAYNTAKQQLAQQQNDALTSAQVGGINVGLQANQQGFNQALQQSNLPYTQLGAFQQATQPGYVNPYNQAAVSGPDYTGAYSTGQAAALAAQNAANARTANMQNGLYSLGGAALLGSGGIGGLVGSGGIGGLVGSVGTGLTGLSKFWNNLTNSNLGGGSAYDQSSAIQNANDIFGDTGAGTTVNSFGQNINNDYLLGI
jgi:hypothetical protein